MARTEFGKNRTSCACHLCVTNCRFMPGFLIPADLDRLLPPNADPFKWAERNLLASPGAMVMKDGQIFRIPTLVPATKSDGSCMHLSDKNLCTIHENAPFGCAFFDCGPPPEGLSEAGLRAVMEEWRKCSSLYFLLWHHLNTRGKTQRSPEESRRRMREALEAEAEEQRKIEIAIERLEIMEREQPEQFVRLKKWSESLHDRE